MKILNRKGFTLIELLAVIVVLAIVLVVTIPAVLSSMETAREKQFKNAVATIDEYMTKQIQTCNVGDPLLAKYDSSLFVKGDNGCVVAHQNAGTAADPDYYVTDETVADIITAAGYSYSENCSDDGTSDFCQVTILVYGKVEEAESPAKSKFGQRYGYFIQ